MSRPEHVAPPEIFYNDIEAKKYALNSRMMNIQTRMAERAIELLALNENHPGAHLLDIGCGSGLSGETLTEAGYFWTGIDISPSMLGVALTREVEGDLILSDIGQGLMFRPGTFDGAISISVIQWLCNADKSTHNPQRRMRVFFSSLFSCLKAGARAVFQFYPETPKQMNLIREAALASGFSGGLVIDYPNSTKAKKYFLCLYAGESHNYKLPAAKDGLEESDDLDTNTGANNGDESLERKSVLFTRPSKETIRNNRQAAGNRSGVKSRDWILAKKERQRRQGKIVKPDTKYTGRTRGPKF